MSAPLTVLSMGWGVQTWTLAAMMALRVFPPADVIVHADTHHERQATYAFAHQMVPWLREHGISVDTVAGKRTDSVRAEWSDSVMVPAYTVDKRTGDRGQLRRQCTHDWKVMPIRSFLRSELLRRGQRRQPGVVDLLLGISLDEFGRVRTSDVAYISNRYPLVSLRMTRADCIAWLSKQTLPVPPKSSCSFCPYRSRESWRELKRLGGPDWEEAVAVDQNIRERRPKHGPLYIHPARQPLSQAIDIPEDSGATQSSFFDACESGLCWV